MPFNCKYFLLTLLKTQRFIASQFWLLFISCLVLLVGGVVAPMLALEVKLLELSFTFLEEAVTFKDQVFFYQSKGIFDVIFGLMSSGSILLIFVGILLSAFSIILPILKLVAYLVFYFDTKGFKENTFVKFLVIKSSILSMTDILVVAILISYVSLDKIINENLSGPHTVTSGHGCYLESGFYLFFGFCITSMIFSSILKKQRS